MRNPYAEVHRRIRSRRGRGPSWLLALLAAGVAAPLARPVLLGFLDGPASPEIVAAGTEAIAFRLAALVVCVMALSTYDAIVRGPDREVLDVHPIQPPLLLQAIAVRLLREQAFVPAMAIILLIPLALAGHVPAFLGAAALVLGAFVCGFGLGFLVNLGAVWAAYSPALAGVLELLRGSNPRMQAALIYAPGVVLGLAGVALLLASGGASAALSGWAPGWAFLALPPAVGLVAYRLSLPLSERTWVAASALLAEVDAAWAGSEEGDEDRRVYLEWIATGRPEVLRALRQGWRRLRTWATGAWGLGLVGAFAGWSADPTAPTAVVAVGGAAVLLIAALPTRLADGDPVWLDRALGVSDTKVAIARAIVAFAYAQGAILPPLFALLIRQGLAFLVPAIVLEGLALVACLASASLTRRLGSRALWAWVPIAVVAWALVASLTVRTLGGLP